PRPTATPPHPGAGTPSPAQRTMRAEAGRGRRHESSSGSGPDQCRRILILVGTVIPILPRVLPREPLVGGGAEAAAPETEVRLLRQLRDLVHHPVAAPVIFAAEHLHHLGERPRVALELLPHRLRHLL